MHSIEIIPCVCGHKTSELQCFPLDTFCGICRRKILKIPSYIKEFCAKAKEVDQININFCMTDKRFDITQT